MELDSDGGKLGNGRGILGKDLLAENVVFENGVVEDGVVEDGVVEDGVVEDGVVDKDGVGVKSRGNDGGNKLDEFEWLTLQSVGGCWAG